MTYHREETATKPAQHRMEMEMEMEMEIEMEMEMGLYFTKQPDSCSNGRYSHKITHIHVVKTASISRGRYQKRWHNRKQIPVFFGGDGDGDGDGGGGGDGNGNGNGIGEDVHGGDGDRDRNVDGDGDCDDDDDDDDDRVVKMTIVLHV